MSRFLGLALLLSGCASVPGPAIEVQVPVSVPCLGDAVARPAFSSDADLLALDEYSFVISLWRDRILRGQYEALLEAAVAGCL